MSACTFSRSYSGSKWRYTIRNWLIVKCIISLRNNKFFSTALAFDKFPLCTKENNQTSIPVLSVSAFSILSQIQGPILSKDLNTMSAQLDNISGQLQDRGIARKLQSIGIAMRNLALRRVKPLMKLQDDLVYRLAILELQVQPLWRQVNQSISHLRTIQYYIDHQGDKIAQLVSVFGRASVLICKRVTRALHIL